MDIDHLRAFLALAELRHFGRAASRLNVTQPALTKRIQALERALGMHLFARDSTGTALTKAGSSLIRDAQRTVEAASGFLARAGDVRAGQVGRLDLGFGLSAIDLAPRLVRDFRLRWPDVSVTLNDFSSAEQMERLLDGRLDIGFVRMPERSSLAMYPLVEERLAIAMPVSEAAAATRPVDLEGLNQLGFIMLDHRRGPGLSATDRAMERGHRFHSAGDPGHARHTDVAGACRGWRRCCDGARPIGSFVDRRHRPPAHRAWGGTLEDRSLLGRDSGQPSQDPFCRYVQ